MGQENKKEINTGEKMTNEWDIEELAYRVMGKTDSEAAEAIENGDIDEAIYNKYECSFETYCKIANDLVKFTPIVKSALSGKKFHAFVDNEDHRAILKVDI